MLNETIIVYSVRHSLHRDDQFIRRPTSTSRHIATWLATVQFQCFYYWISKSAICSKII